MKLNHKSKSITSRLRAHKTACALSALAVISICYAITKFSIIANVSMVKNDSMMLEEGYEVRGPALTAEALAARVGRLNAERRERNAELFPPQPGGAVLAVQAGRGAVPLQRLLLALARVDGIDEALLVVSHSFYDDRLNTLVRSVRFCRVLQIFFPHSRQLFPVTSPGDPADCLKVRVAGGDCAQRGDRAEHKQHWWWTAHFLFNHYLGDSERLVLFLQEDNYVARDLLYMLRFAQSALAYHPDAEVISLGKPWPSQPDFAALTVEPWRPPCQRGLAFNRSVWRQVEARAALFCAYDDASWSYSLLNVFTALRRGHAGMVASVVPRVLSAPVRFPAGALSPPRVRCVFLASPSGRVEPRLRAPPHGNGGWDDPRDQLLCLDPFLATTTYSVPYTSTPNSEQNNTTLLFQV